MALMIKGNKEITISYDKVEEYEKMGYKVVTEQDLKELEKQREENQMGRVSFAPASLQGSKEKEAKITKLEAENTKQAEEIKGLTLLQLTTVKELKQGQSAVLEAEKARADTKAERKKVIDNELETLTGQIKAIDEEFDSLNK